MTMHPTTRTRRNHSGNRRSSMPAAAAKPRAVAVLVSMGVLAFVLVLLPVANGLPASAAPMPARAGRYNRRIPSMQQQQQQQQQPNPQNPLGMPSDIAFGPNGLPSPAGSSGAHSTSSGTPNALSLVLYPKQYFAGPATPIELDPVLPPLASESSPSSSSADPKAPPPTVRHSVCITLSDPLHAVHSAKLIGATHSAKLYAQPGCMADDAGFILDPTTGRPIKADGATLSLTASGHYLTLRKGRGFNGPLRSVRLCSEKEREKCH